ncbi:type II toxin-antitoxin system RelE/ParE family toxin [Desulfobacula sp.]|uniref:type II toxin-antitoxin system RelE family toxin n=1 Tax=Desulfobacula sp. TaxID=2593537 RepID=UPI00262B0D8B|nr:type II toxin-antitoxin system RelE/ParE family toxin [Desulfobacula sp.]
MAWTINFIPKVKKELKKLDKKDSKAILDFLEKEVLLLDDPREKAIRLKENLRKFWKFRVGQFRIIADIQENKLLVLVVRIANRKDVYKKFKEPKEAQKIVSFSDLKK